MEIEKLHFVFEGRCEETVEFYQMFVWLLVLLVFVLVVGIVATVVLLRREMRTLMKVHNLVEPDEVYKAARR